MKTNKSWESLHHRLNKKKGRKSKLDLDIVRKLVAAFNNDYNVREACVYSGIGKTTYYDWLEKNKEFADTISASQRKISMKCKLIIADRINNGDVRAAMWWLEHKRPEEFSLKAEFLHKRAEFQGPIVLSPDEYEKYQKVYLNESKNQK